MDDISKRLDRLERAVVRAEALRLELTGVTSGYLSTDCPCCERRRLELIEGGEATCEKCGWTSDTSDTEGE